MKLTFSADATLDAGDNFAIVIPLADDAAQMDRADSNLIKNRTFFTQPRRPIIYQ
jgi:hypothetical protein